MQIGSPYCFFFLKGRGLILNLDKVHSKIYMKITEVKKNIKFYPDSPSSSSPMASLECRNQSALLVPILMINPKILEMPQDPTL